MSVLRKIKDDKYYTIREIHKNRFFFWYKDYGSIWRCILRDIKGENILQAEVSENNYRNIYRIKGEYIKKYIKQFMDA